MANTPSFASLRDLDQAVEQEIAKYLDSHLYIAPDFNSATRVTDLAAQRAGKDIIVSSTKLNLNNAVIDEKSASHHVNNKSLHTFAFELSFFRRDQDNNYSVETEGWLLSSLKQTEYYLVIWPWANNITLYSFGNKDYPYFTSADIVKLEYALISRQAILDFLVNKKFDRRWLGITASKIREHAASQKLSYYKETYKTMTFACSAQLNEKPVNVLIEKNDLLNMAILKGGC